MSYNVINSEVANVHAAGVVVVSKGSVPMNLAKSKNASHFRSSSPGSQGHVHRQQSFEAEHMNKLKLLLRNLLKCLAHCEKNVATAADLSASHSQRTSPATAARKASQKPKMKAGNPKKRQKKKGRRPLSSFFALWDPVLVRHSGENRQAQWPQAPRLVVFCATNGQIDNVPPRQRVRRVRTSTWDQNLQDFCAPKKRVPEQIVRILLARQLSMCFVKVWSRAETSSKCE